MESLKQKSNKVDSRYWASKIKEIKQNGTFCLVTDRLLPFYSLRGQERNG